MAARKKTPAQQETKPRSGTRGVKRKNKRVAYPDEFREEVVEMVQEIGDVKQVAAMYDLEPRRVKGWCNKANVDLSAIEATSNRSVADPVATTPTTKTKTKSATTNSDREVKVDDAKDFADHQERKQSLSHLFAVMDARVKSEGLDMKESQLKAIATGMAIVSDKLDLLNKKELGIPAGGSSSSKIKSPLPDNVLEFMPAAHGGKS